MIKMHTARFFNDSYGGREERVQLFQWNMTLELGHIRYGSYGTHGRLVCSHCDAAIKHVKEKKSIAGGSLRERHEHFETVRGEKHADDCAWGIKPHHQKRLTVDKTKGYRIHLNLPHFSEEFNEAANGAYRRKRGFIYELDDDLKDRERIVVKSAAQSFRTLWRKLIRTVLIHPWLLRATAPYPGKISTYPKVMSLP